MTDYIATLGLVLLFVADYIGIIVWLMRTTSIPHQSFRFSMRGLLVAVTFVAIHLGMFTAFLSELSPDVR